jgi:hypothetical protein
MKLRQNITGRVSGHLRIERTRMRRGDNAQLARVSFVDSLTDAPKPAEAKPAAKKPIPTTKKASPKAEATK